MNIVALYYPQRKMDRVNGQKHLLIATTTLLWFLGSAFFAKANPAALPKLEEAALEHFENYCFDCHDGEAKKGDLDLASLLKKAVLMAL